MSRKRKEAPEPSTFEEALEQIAKKRKMIKQLEAEVEELEKKASSGLMPHKSTEAIVKDMGPSSFVESKLTTALVPEMQEMKFRCNKDCFERVSFGRTVAVAFITDITEGHTTIVHYKVTGCRDNSKKLLRHGNHYIGDSTRWLKRLFPDTVIDHKEALKDIPKTLTVNWSHPTKTVDRTLNEWLIEGAPKCDLYHFCTPDKDPKDCYFKGLY